MSLEKQVDESVLTDVGKFILSGVEPGGLSKKILYGKMTVEEMLPYCHELARPHLSMTKEIIDKMTMGLFHGMDITDDKAMDNIRIILVVGDKINFWKMIVPFRIPLVDVLKGVT